MDSKTANKPSVMVTGPNGTDTYKASTVAELREQFDVDTKRISDLRVIRGDRVLDAGDALHEGDAIQLQPVGRGAAESEEASSPSVLQSTEVVQVSPEGVSKPKKVLFPKVKIRDLTESKYSDLVERPEIRFSPHALNHVVSVLYNFKQEFGFRCLGYRLSNTKVVVTDIFIPSQHVSSANFEYTDKGYVELAPIFANPRRNLGWGHSHAEFEAFHSSVDAATDEANVLMNKLPTISVTVSRKLEDWDALFYTRIFPEEIWRMRARLSFGRNILSDLEKLHTGSRGYVK